MMKFEEAALTYCNRVSMARGTVNKMLAWNPQQSIKQNALALGLTHSWAIRFSRRFGLKSRVQ